MVRRALVLGAAAGLLIVALLGGVAWWLLQQVAPPAQLLILNEQQLQLRNGDGSGQGREVARDASDELFRYPVPAPDGRSLAYVSMGDAAAALTVLELADGARREVYRSADSPPMYINWSPDGRYLSFLVNASAGGLHTYVVPADGSRAAELISPDSPSYFVWSPDSSTLLLHTGGSWVEGGRVQTYRPGETARPIFSDPGLFFRTPAWSVDGAQLFYVVQPPVEGQFGQNDIESVLVRAAPDGSAATPLISEQDALLFFARSPQSDTLAYIKLSANERALYLLENDQARRLSKEGDVVGEFFWSPDGRTIAYLSSEATAATEQVRERVCIVNATHTCCSRNSSSALGADTKL
jgi:TolB protein